MKDNVLRKKLAEHNLVTWGTRQEMQRRFTEWVTLWNANCDATHPKSKSELRSELDVWERTQGAQAQHSSLNPGAQIRSKEFDRDAWSSQNDGSFKQLIADARKKAQEAKKLLESRPISPLVSPPVPSVPEAPSDSSIPSNPIQISDPQDTANLQFEEHHKAPDSLPNQQQQYSVPPHMEAYSRQAEMMRDHERNLERERVERKNSSPVKQSSQAHDPNQRPTPTHNEWYGTRSSENQAPGLQNGGNAINNTYNGRYGPPNTNLTLPEEITAFYEQHPLPRTNTQAPSSPNGVVRGLPGTTPGPNTSHEYPSPSKLSYGFGDGAPYYGRFQ